MNTLVCIAVLSLALSATSSAFAHEPDDGHTPICHCWSEGQDVVCKAGHAGGWPERHANLVVFTEDGRLVWSDKTDDNGAARFKRPAGAFYILVGDKPGETLEVTWRDVRSTRLKGR